jgi:phosphoglycolate phosphatase-like HAD superfamily hydrolase
MRQIFAKFNLPATEENFTKLADAYLLALPAEMHDPRAHVLPGVRSLLTALGQSKEVAQGLLTGNLERGARVKLGHHGIWDHFAFGAYADDSELRNELGPHALRRAGARHGVSFPPERVWVIGDTPYDIECARAIGANSLAVATGLYTVEALAAHRPTALLADLSDADAFWNLTGLRPSHSPAS